MNGWYLNERGTAHTYGTEEYRMATKKRLTPNVCSAARCKQTTQDPEGRDTCAKHKVALAPIDRATSEQAAVMVEATKAELLEALEDASLIPLDAEIELPDGRTVLGLARIGELRDRAAARFKELETHRKSVTGRMLELKRQVDEIYKPGTELATQVQRLCTARIDESVRAQRAAQEQALAQLAEASRAGDSAFALVHKPIELPAGTSVRTEMTYTVTDFSLVPDAYKMLNEAAVRAHLQVTAGTVAIPGIEIGTEVRTVRR